MKKFLSKVRDFLPEDRIYTDSLRRFAWGTDAGFYRLVPQVVDVPTGVYCPISMSSG
jgi:hypothetical protein